MRRYRQKKLLEIIGTMNAAHDAIINAFAHAHAKTAIHILSECQETAASIIDFIEEFEEGQTSSSIALLEDYYKELYEISENAENSGDNVVKVSKLLKKHLIKIETAVKTELEPKRFEVLFLPYKASMWDSLESIWLSAKDNPQCDTLVMPIPYYDKKSDGTLGEMHCEDHLYPEYVPVINWEEYNIEDHRPDIIFIHNPYDSFNNVTQVHPDYFCKRLSGLTEMLVYVPYFVCADDVAEQFCVLPGTMYADKVIVQSNKVRKTYISEYHKLEKAQDKKDIFGNAEEKFVALGSPKFDKVLNTRTEDCKIPEDWQRLIEAPDGSRKKVVLYNTTIISLLEGSENVLLKLKYVFGHFKGRDDVVLLWRPHPLSETAYGAMRPELMREYLKITEDFRREGWGIYDDSADLNRAIAISDAYYGDWGSLVPLYQCTGKPIMIQNNNIDRENENLRKLRFFDLYDNGDSYLTVSCDFNGLFRIDKITWNTEYMGSFPNNKLHEGFPFKSICRDGNKLYFAPLRANEIAVYDIESLTFDRINLSCPKIKTKAKYNPAYKFCSVVKYNRYLFFVSCSFPAFVRYGLDDGSVDYFYDWVNPLNELVSEPYDDYFRVNAAVTGPYFAVAAYNANAVVIFDMDTCVSEVYEVGDSKYQYASICFDGKDYWMAPKHEGPVVRWNRETGEYREYTLPYEYGFCKHSYKNLSYTGGHIWLFPNQAKASFKIDVIDGAVTIAEAFQPECEYAQTDKDMYGGLNYIQAKSLDGKLYALTGKTSKLIEFDLETGHRREQPILIPQEIEEKVQSYAFYKDAALCKQSYDCYFYESNFVSLRGFLGHITQYGEDTNMELLRDKQLKLFNNEISKVDGSSGGSIFSYCIKSV